MDKFLFNFKIVIEWMLPVENRAPQFIAWIYDLIAYLRKLHTDFISWGNDKLDEVTWNCQTINLENQLILVFGSGIYIQNNLRRALPMFGYPYHDSRNKISYPYSNPKNRICYPYGTFDPSIKAFTVFVPSALIFDEVKMKAIIDKYTLIGTKNDYEILTY